MKAQREDPNQYMKQTPISLARDLSFLMNGEFPYLIWRLLKNPTNSNRNNL